MSLGRITDVKCRCPCGWSGTVADCIGDVDGDGSLGCPRCESVITVVLDGPRKKLSLLPNIKRKMHHVSKAISQANKTLEDPAAKFYGEFGRRRAEWLAESYHETAVIKSYEATLEDAGHMNYCREQFEAILDIRRMHREDK